MISERSGIDRLWAEVEGWLRMVRFYINDTLGELGPFGPPAHIGQGIGGRIWSIANRPAGFGFNGILETPKTKPRMI